MKMNIKIGIMELMKFRDLKCNGAPKIISDLIRNLHKYGDHGINN
jgi:hypothetical protein